MRKMMWFAIGFAVACAVSILLFTGFWMVVSAVFCLLGAIAFCFVKTNPGRRIAAALFGCTVAFLWVWCFHTFYLQDAKELDGKTVSTVFTANDYSYDTDYGVAVDGSIIICGKSYQMKAYIPEGEHLVPGDKTEGSFRLRYTSFGGSKDPTYHQGKGIFLLGYCQSITRTTKASSQQLRYFPQDLRQKILSLLDSVFPEDTVGLARALLLGDKTQLRYEDNRSFQTSGISHVIAVSGMHVAILFSFLYPLCGKRPVIAVLIAIPILFLFSAVAGFTPSIVRACIMQSLMILALLVKREYDPPTALSFSVLALLVANPMTILNVGFQLSVACMAGIFLFYAPIRDYLLDKRRLGAYGNKSRKGRVGTAIAGSIAMTLSASIFTLPLCAFHFGIVSIIGPITNLFVLWLVTLSFYGIMAVCIVGAIWLPLGQITGWIFAWPMRLVSAIADAFAGAPLAAVYTDSIYVTLWLIFTYVLLCAMYLRKGKNPKPTAAAVAVGLILAILFSWGEARLDMTRVTVLNVGQGQSILLQSGNSRYLVDCGAEDGNSADVVANYLHSRGIFRLEGIILTHYDSDHAGDIADLLTQIEVDCLLLPDTMDENGLRQEIEAACSDKIIWIREDTRVQMNPGWINLYVAENPGNDNESSMCALFHSENCDILITGDRSTAGERALLEKAELPQLELLIAGHHGASDATGRELLLKTRPAAVAISCGESKYGHPADSVLRRLQEFGCSVYRTDQMGTIIFRG